MLNGKSLRHSVWGRRKGVDMRNKRVVLVVVCFSLVVSVCPLLYSQATGSLAGTVSDKAGAVVSGATVKATSRDTGAVREAKTDDSGHYLIPLLPVAYYTLRFGRRLRSARQKSRWRLRTLAWDR